MLLWKIKQAKIWRKSSYICKTKVYCGTAWMGVARTMLSEMNNAETLRVNRNRINRLKKY